MKKLIIFIIGTVILFSQAETFATPSLGVATDSGIYSYTGSTPPTDNYINYFATIFEAGSVEGFVIGPSGSYLTVFTSYNPSTTPIWLLANTGSDNFPMTFGGSNLSGLGDIGKAGGYNQNDPYYGTQLSNVLSDWTQITDWEASKTFYLYERQITYADGFDPEDYFFACADINDTSGLWFGSGRKDDFSPKTSSACDETGKIPEPATLSLLGLGLIGFVLKFRKERG